MDRHILGRYGPRVSQRPVHDEEAPHRVPAGSCWLGVVRRHPVITSVLVGCTLVGALLGPLLLTSDWSLLRRKPAYYLGIANAVQEIEQLVAKQLASFRGTVVETENPLLMPV